MAEAAASQVLNPFDADIAVEPLGENRFGAVIRENWWVGRGPNGGYIAAILINATGRGRAGAPAALAQHPLHAPSGRRPSRDRGNGRAPGPGGELPLGPPRAGGQGLGQRPGRLLRPLAGALLRGLLDAPGPTPEELAHLLPEEQGLPAFFHNYEVVPAIGSPPFLSAEEPVTGGWIRSREPRALDPPLAAAILDAWIPTAFIVLDRAHPAPTLDLTIHFRSPLPPPGSKPDDWYLSVFRSGLARDGFFDEDGELWSADGRLLAQSRQLALLLG